MAVEVVQALLAVMVDLRLQGLPEITVAVAVTEVVCYVGAAAEAEPLGSDKMLQRLQQVQATEAQARHRLSKAAYPLAAQAAAAAEHGTVPAWQGSAQMVEAPVVAHPDHPL